MEAIFVEQFFGANPKRVREWTDAVPKRVDFSNTQATKEKVKMFSPLVGSLGRPDGPEKLWEQSLLNEWWAQTLQGLRDSTD